MPEIQVRPATSADIPVLCALDAAYTTDAVWRMDAAHPQGALFREMRLPRSVRVAYPRDLERLAETWTRFDALLVAVLQGHPVAFSALEARPGGLAWLRDLVVAPRWRRQGIGAALVLASLRWAQARACTRLTAEMQPRNVPAIRLVEKLGFLFSGYHQHYYAYQETALFFTRSW